MLNFVGVTFRNIVCHSNFRYDNSLLWADNMLPWYKSVAYNSVCGWYVLHSPVYMPQAINYIAFIKSLSTLHRPKWWYRSPQVLKSLTKEELQMLFRELSLSSTTVENNYDGSNVYAYKNDLIRKWIHGDDEVKKKGGATWENLNTALKGCGIGISSKDDWY